MNHNYPKKAKRILPCSNVITRDSLINELESVLRRYGSLSDREKYFCLGICLHRVKEK